MWGRCGSAAGVIVNRAIGARPTLGASAASSASVGVCTCGHYPYSGLVSTPAFWQAVEAIHDPIYFTPRATARYQALGLQGFWMGYFASRSAAVGTPGPGLVTALFHGFAPERVARALPDAWEMADRDAILQARIDAAREVLADALGDVDVHDIVGHLDEVHKRTIFAGKPLAAAHAELIPPGDDIGRLWHHATWLRELHGDAHIAVLTAAGIDGATANTLASAAGLVPDGQRESRGWSEQAWDDAYEQLHMRGWVDEFRAITSEGRSARERIEGATHRVANAAIGDREATARTIAVTDALVALARQIAETGPLYYPNPTGVPAP